ncbi:hypothetical protein [Streptomyces alboniger]|uniref:hypothetical protein n=1 Tax=Streptomyces alboniger TaxID=132473 RepID=UPI0006E17C37|nr:hypothetical protein [Streptomyces alboniger]
MAQTYGLGQTSRPHRHPADPRQTPEASEATRLLCAGTYLDGTFREAVIDELYVHEERLAAPSFGIDAARVLAHALRARRIELAWAAIILFLWVVAVPLTEGVVACYLFSFALIVLAGWIRGAGQRPGWIRRVAAWHLRWAGRGLFLLTLWGLLRLATGGFGSGSRVLLPDVTRTQAWISFTLPLLMAWAVAGQRGQFAKALTGELSRSRFPDIDSDPAEQAEGIRFRRLSRRIRREQHAPLMMYRPVDPFCGAGTPYKPWSFSIELRPQEEAEPTPMDNGTILHRIVPLLEALREPSPHGAPYLADAVRDRLRELKVEEVVFLPVDGLPERSRAPYTAEAFEEHRSRSVEEGGETRRHFLRVRVGGWDEEIVTTVFVRVHTQGGMLMLEVAPHVLRPVKQLYQYADRVAHQYRHNHRFGRAVWALGMVSTSAGRAVVTLWHGCRSLWQIASGGHAKALADGPWASVRELGSDDEASLFQEMDVSRYLKSIQERVTEGVKLALSEAGWQTGEFERQIVNLAEGAQYIGRAYGVAVGDHNTVTSNTHTTHLSATRRTGGGHANT